MAEEDDKNPLQDVSIMQEKEVAFFSTIISIQHHEIIQLLL